MSGEGIAGEARSDVPESTCAPPPGFWKDIVMHTTHPPLVRKFNRHDNITTNAAASDYDFPVSSSLPTSQHQGLVVKQLPPKPNKNVTTRSNTMTLWEEDALIAFRSYDVKSEMRSYMQQGATPATIQNFPAAVQKGMRLASLWTMLVQKNLAVDPTGGIATASGAAAAGKPGPPKPSFPPKRPTDEKKKSEIDLLEEQFLAEEREKEKLNKKVPPSTTTSNGTSESDAATAVDNSLLVGPLGFGAIASLIKQDQVARIQCLRPWARFTHCFPTKKQAEPFVAVAAMLHKLIFHDKESTAATTASSSSVGGGDSDSPSAQSAGHKERAVTVEDIAVFLHVAENHSQLLFEGGSVRVVLAIGSCCETVRMKSISNCQITLLKDDTDGLRFRASAIKVSDNDIDTSLPEDERSPFQNLSQGSRIKISSSRYLTVVENDQEKMLFEGYVDAGAAADPKAKAMDLLSKMGLGQFAPK